MIPNPVQSRQFQNSPTDKNRLFQKRSLPCCAVLLFLCFILKDQIENLKIETVLPKAFDHSIQDCNQLRFDYFIL